jgi:deoxyribonuclease V
MKTDNIKNKFMDIQKKLTDKIELKNKFELKDIKLAAGVDLAYWDYNGKHYAVCCIVVVDFQTGGIKEKVWSSGEVTVPYIPGFLAFRELPLITEANAKLINKPDIYMFDGNGYLHYTHMGIATHASFHLNKPTIGIAKSYLKIKNTEFTMPENISGSYTDIVINGEIYGRALRTHKNVKPVFVSCGNWIELDTATDITMHFINNESRLPVPVRLADLETHIMREKQKETE